MGSLKRDLWPRFQRRWLPRRALEQLRRGGAPCDPRELGLVGEALVEREARARGWRVVAKRIAGPPAEIDLLCRSRGVWRLVEVKTRRRPRPRPGKVNVSRPAWPSLSDTQARRLGRAARALERTSGKPAEVWLVEVLLTGPGWDLEIRWRRLPRIATSVAGEASAGPSP